MQKDLKYKPFVAVIASIFAFNHHLELNSLIKLLVKLFVKNADKTSDKSVRRSFIVLGSLTGVVCNLFLFAVKLTIGILSGSVSILADAFNNLSDIGSSVVTLAGFKLSEKPADKEHPFGHGRIEYMSALIVSAIIMLVGFELFKSSVGKIIHPNELTVNLFTILALVVSVCVKLWMSFFNRNIGKTIHSEALIATSQDSLNDCIATTAVLISILIYSFFRINIDAYTGIAVALFVIYSGFRTAKDTLDPLLGSPPDPEMIKELEQQVLSFNEFIGVHDLIVHNYGPGRSFASLHVEVPKDIDIVKCHEKIDLCERLISERMGLELVIHMDPVVTDDQKTMEIHCAVLTKVKSIDSEMTIHDFRIVEGQERTNLIFDVVTPTDCKLSVAQVKSMVDNLCKEIDPTYSAVVTVDKNFIVL